jgi:hypothetical protein
VTNPMDSHNDERSDWGDYVGAAAAPLVYGGEAADGRWSEVPLRRRWRAKPGSGC